MAYTKEQARVEIGRLVNDFEANRSRLQNQAEAQIENNYIRPLFEFLNWNTRNVGLPVADFEFVLNRTIRTGKRPDYILQLDRQQLLVMDAKQVKYDMHDPRWLNQVYAYAYSTQNLPPARRIDFAILTDFEEFLVLDCTFRIGNPNALTNFLVINWTCEKYLSQFDQLWDLFERENMRHAARTRGNDQPTGIWKLALSPKKVHANRILPDQAFLADMDDDETGWRVCLAKDMKKHNPQADGTLITAAVQLLIDRLIFVKALSDRELEEDYLDRLVEIVENDGLGDRDTGWFSACRSIFNRLNQFYNGSIFESRPEIEAITVSNKVVRNIIRSLQPSNSPYNFAVLPIEILGTIYERFLGRVVRATEQRIKIEKKPEVRKAGGVYYTPQYIVEHIVKNTVGRLLKRCQVPADVAKLKILDPACGSGSFLVGAYAALIDWHIQYFSGKKKLSAKDRSDAYLDFNGQVRLTAKLKRQILCNNLFGVDIDSQAVEVTRFSLSLKALEDTRRDELDEERSLYNQAMLPNLKQNIKCGNSLIGPDYFMGHTFTDPAELLRINPFDWMAEFSQIIATGGFDCVIGNPPWGADFTEQELAYLRKSNQAIIVRMIDSFMYFVHLSCNKLKTNGFLGFILPDVFLYQKSNLKLRDFILKNFKIDMLLNMGNVFDQVIRPACILTAERKMGPYSTISVADFSKISKSDKINAILENTHFSSIHQNDILIIPGMLFITSNHAQYNIWKKINKVPHKLLGELVDDDGIQRGVSPDLKQAFLVDSKTVREFGLEKSILRRVLTGGKQVRRYFIEDTDLWLIYTNNSSNFRKLPNTCAYIDQFKSDITCNEVKQRKHSLYALHRARQEHIFQKSQKIIGVITEDEIIVAPDDAQIFTTDGLYLFGAHESVNMNYLLAILNSKLFVFIYRLLTLEKGRALAQVKPTTLTQLPIRTINFSDPTNRARHDQMVQLVESILTLHKHKAAATSQAEQEKIKRQIAATDNQVDALVYKLYDLTAEEIAIVDIEARRE